MKNLLKFVPICLVLACSSLFANTQENQDLEITTPVENSFGYVSIGVEPLFSAPSFGFGYRMQKGHHGLDLSASIVCENLDYASYFEELDYSKRKANLLYNFFFFPNCNSQVYVGLGIGVNYIGIEQGGSIVGFSPEFVLGKQYKNRKNNQRFIQVQISLPGLYARSKKITSHPNYALKVKDLEYAPLFTFFYGIGF